MMKYNELIKKYTELSRILKEINDAAIDNVIECETENEEDIAHEMMMLNEEFDTVTLARSINYFLMPDVITGTIKINDDAVTLHTNSNQIILLRADVLIEIEIEDGFFEPFKVDLISEDLDGATAKLRCNKKDFGL